MASTNTTFSPYVAGASLSYPIIKHCPYNDWRKLLIRVKVKTGSELFIGALCEQADTGTYGVVEKTADKSLKVYGIVVDNLENKRQLEKDTGATATKTAFFAANSYIWIFPLIPGTIIEARIAASNTIDEGNYLCATASGDFRLLAGIGTDVDQQAKIARVIGSIVTSGTGVQYISAVIV